MIALHGFAHELRAAGITVPVGAEWTAMRAEMVELKSALDHGDRSSIARGLADVCYTSYQIAVAHGMFLDDAIKEVHASRLRVARDEPFRTPVMAKAINKRVLLEVT